MIILTGSKGFIGKKFLKSLTEKGKKVIEIEKNDCWEWRECFNDWNDVECALSIKEQCHQQQIQI